jgi:hypothetical protein
VGLSTKRRSAGGKRPGGGKVKFLAILPTPNIKAMKHRAIERGVNASEILEEAVAAWLKLNRTAAPRLADKVPASEKRQFLAKMDARLIKQIKVMAIDWKTSASALVGEAVATCMSRMRDETK